MDFLLSYDGGDTLVRVYQDMNDQEFDFIIPYQINSIMVDPENWLVKKIIGVNYISDFRIDKSQLFMIWPNPAGDQLNIKFENMGWDHLVTISDLSGKILTRFLTRDNQVQLPLDFLPQGIFLIKVDEYGRQSVQKFVKNK